MPQHTWSAGGLLAAVACSVAGCSALSMSNPWTFERPPAVAARDDSARHGGPGTGRTVIAVAPFANPATSVLRWRDIGAGMSDALRRALLNEGDFDVRIDPQIERSLLRSAARRSEAPGADSDVDFVVTGKVTDFHHTAALPGQLSRWGLFSKRSEAVVAIEWSVVDVRTRRVVAADHVYGTAKAGREPVEELYSGVAFGSYLFWSTPLGKASRQAIERTIGRVREALPSHVGEPRIVKHEGGRKVAVIGGWAWGLAEGKEYYVCEPSEAQTAPRPIYDADTGRPLMVRIHRVRKESSTAWLLGKPPGAVDLRGAVLLRERPATPDGPIQQDGRPALADRSGGGPT